MLVFSPKLHAYSTTKFCLSHSERKNTTIILGVIYFIYFGKRVVNFLKIRNAQSKENRVDYGEVVNFLYQILFCVLALCIVIFLPNDITCKFY